MNLPIKEEKKNNEKTKKKKEMKRKTMRGYHNVIME